VVPTRDELTSAHVVTGMAADGTFAVSGFGPQPNLHETEQQTAQAADLCGAATD